MFTLFPFFAQTSVSTVQYTLSIPISRTAPRYVRGFLGFFHDWEAGKFQLELPGSLYLYERRHWFCSSRGDNPRKTIVTIHYKRVRQHLWQSFAGIKILAFPSIPAATAQPGDAQNPRGLAPLRHLHGTHARRADSDDGRLFALRRGLAQQDTPPASSQKLGIFAHSISSRSPLSQRPHTPGNWF